MSRIIVKQFNSACEKAGGQLLNQAVEEKKKRKASVQRNIAQGAKEIASDLGYKARGRVIFIPSKNYSRNYDKINWGSK